MINKVVAILVLVMLIGIREVPLQAQASDSVIITIDYTKSETEIVYTNDDTNLPFTPFSSYYVNGSLLIGKNSSLVITEPTASATGNATKIGYKNIYVRVWNSGSSSYFSTSVIDIYTTNASSFSGVITLSNPISGKTYQVIGTFFAIINGVEYTFYKESDTLTY